MSNYKHFSKMYILVRVIALPFHYALSVRHACARQHTFRTKSVKLSGEKAHARLTAKWKYFHGFQTFTDREYTCEM